MMSEKISLEHEKLVDELAIYLRCRFGYRITYRDNSLILPKPEAVGGIIPDIVGEKVVEKKTVKVIGEAELCSSLASKDNVEQIMKFAGSKYEFFFIVPRHCSEIAIKLFSVLGIPLNEVSKNHLITGTG